jgi:hypothetical protein
MGASMSRGFSKFLKTPLRGGTGPAGRTSGPHHLKREGPHASLHPDLYPARPRPCRTAGSPLHPSRPELAICRRAPCMAQRRPMGRRVSLVLGSPGSRPWPSQGCWVPSSRGWQPAGD